MAAPFPNPNGCKTNAAKAAEQGRQREYDHCQNDEW